MKQLNISIGKIGFPNMSLLQLLKEELQDQLLYIPRLKMKDKNYPQQNFLQFLNSKENLTILKFRLLILIKY